MSFKEHLKDAANKYGISLNEVQIDQFDKYFQLLIEWNEKINLTAITEPKEVAIKHMIDSLTCWDDGRFMGNISVIDVGTGAGFPGVCLKIIFPKLHITLMDSLDKRIKFLNEVITSLSLNNISTVHARVEDAARTAEFREQFDFSTARAVASLPVLSEYCLPFVKQGGFFIAYKSEKVLEEISLSANALSLLGGNIESEYSFSLPDSDLQRTILFIRKENKTPDKYPRKAGTPSKKPL